MSLILNGTTGVSKVQYGSIHEEDLHSDVARLGVGQTNQNMTASRVSGTTYNNDTGKPIRITIYITDNSGQSSMLNLYVNNTLVAPANLSGAVAYMTEHSMIVPAGSTYKITYNTLANYGGWWELR